MVVSDRYHLPRAIGLFEQHAARARPAYAPLPAEHNTPAIRVYRMVYELGAMMRDQLSGRPFFSCDRP